MALDSVASNHKTFVSFMNPFAPRYWRSGFSGGNLNYFDFLFRDMGRCILFSGNNLKTFLEILEIQLNTLNHVFVLNRFIFPSISYPTTLLDSVFHICKIDFFNVRLKKVPKLSLTDQFCAYSTFIGSYDPF